MCLLGALAAVPTGAAQPVVRLRTRLVSAKRLERLPSAQPHIRRFGASNAPRLWCDLAGETDSSVCYPISGTYLVVQDRDALWVFQTGVHPMFHVCFGACQSGANSNVMYPERGGLEVWRWGRRWIVHTVTSASLSPTYESWYVVPTGGGPFERWPGASFVREHWMPGAAGFPEAWSRLENGLDGPRVVANLVLRAKDTRRMVLRRTVRCRVSDSGFVCAQGRLMASPWYDFEGYRFVTTFP